MAFACIDIFDLVKSDYKDMIEAYEEACKEIHADLAKSPDMTVIQFYDGEHFLVASNFPDPLYLTAYKLGLLESVEDEIRNTCLGSAVSAIPIPLPLFEDKRTMEDYAREERYLTSIQRMKDENLYKPSKSWDKKKFYEK